MTRLHRILDTKIIDDEKTIALVGWQLISGGVEYGTHVIWAKSEGLHHGRYYNTLEDAKADFEIRE